MNNHLIHTETNLLICQLFKTDLRFLSVFYLNIREELKVGTKASGQDLAIHLAKHIETMGNPTKGLECRMCGSNPNTPPTP